MASTQYDTPFIQDWNQNQHAAYMFYNTMYPLSQKTMEHTYYFKSYIQECSSIGQFRNIYIVPVWPNSWIFVRYRSWQYCLIATKILEHRYVPALPGTRVLESRTLSIPFPKQKSIFKDILFLIMTAYTANFLTSSLCCDRAATVLSSTSGASGRLQNRLSVLTWFLHSDYVLLGT